MLTLALDASTVQGTVAIIRDGVAVASAQTAMREAVEHLMPTVARLLADIGAGPGDIGRVACGAGPGSFTSLRIAASIAKGVAAARSLPLVVSPSPLLILAGAERALAPGSYIAALDALRGDLFTLDVNIDPGGRMAVGGEARLESRLQTESRAAATGATILGPDEAGADCPHARGFAAILRQSLAVHADLARWEPDYGRKAEAQVRWERAHGRALETR
jgi:tRNA threonylcarbamoyladenosine biosynthesis protein TsaB